MTGGSRLASASAIANSYWSHGLMDAFLPRFGGGYDNLLGQHTLCFLYVLLLLSR